MTPKRTHILYSIVVTGFVLCAAFIFFLVRDRDNVIGGVFLSFERIAFLVKTFLVVTLVLFSCYGLGAAIWRPVKSGSISSMERVLFKTALGMCGFSLYLFLLAAVGLFRPLFLFIPLAVGLFYILHLLSASLIHTAVPPSKEANAQYTLPNMFSFIGIFVTTFALIPALVASLTPPNHWDELVYQLTIPKQYLIHNGFVYIPFLVYFNMPHYVNLIYAWLMSFGSDIAPRLFHFLFGVGSGIIIWSLCSRYWNRIAAWFAVIIFFTTPVIVMEMSAALVDVGMTFFFLLAISSLLRWREGEYRDSTWLILAGIFAGILPGIKYQGVLGFISLFFLLVLLVIVEQKRVPRTNLLFIVKLLGIFIIPGIALTLPWFIKNQAMMHNPVYPNLYSLFGGKYWSPEHSEQMSAWLGSMGMGKTPLDFLYLFWRLPMKGWYLYSHFAGIITPFYFLPLPILLFFRHKDRRLIVILLLTGLVFLLLWFMGSQQVRFLIPALSLFAILSGVALAIPLASLNNTESNFITLIFTIVVVTIALTGIFTEPKDIQLLGKRIEVIVDHASEDEYLKEVCAIDNHDMIRYINSNLSSSARILMLFDNRTYYLQRGFIADGTFEVSRICAAVARSESPEDIYRFCLDLGISHVLFNMTYWKGYSGDFIRRFYPSFEKKFETFKDQYLSNVVDMNGLSLYMLEKKR